MLKKFNLHSFVLKNTMNEDFKLYPSHSTNMYMANETPHVGLYYQLTWTLFLLGYLDHMILWFIRFIMMTKMNKIHVPEMNYKVKLLSN